MRTRVAVLLTLAHALTPASTVRAQDAPRERNGWAFFPLLGYSPETQLIGGAFGARFFREPGSATETRPSSISLIGVYTTRSQMIFELDPEFFVDDERYHFQTRIGYQSFPDLFYGLGNDTREADEELYEQKIWRFRTRASMRVWDHLGFGVLADFQHVDVTILAADGLLSRQVLGNTGGWSNGLGMLAEWDDRDNHASAYRGAFHQISVTHFDEAWGSAYKFARLEIDLRQYVQLYGAHVLAFQVFGQLHSGDVPFDRLALLGGAHLRGYYEGRYRDKAMVTAQVEYRFPLFWRFGAVAFAGAGDVAPSLGSFGLDELKWSVGGGLRFALNRPERLNVRVDFGIGLHDRGLYAGIAEAF